MIRPASRGGARPRRPPISRSTGTTPRSAAAVAAAPGRARRASGPDPGSDLAGRSGCGPAPIRPPIPVGPATTSRSTRSGSPATASRATPWCSARRPTGCAGRARARPVEVEVDGAALVRGLRDDRGDRQRPVPARRRPRAPRPSRRRPAGGAGVRAPARANGRRCAAGSPPARTSRTPGSGRAPLAASRSERRTPGRSRWTACRGEPVRDAGRRGRPGGVPAARLRPGGP